MKLKFNESISGKHLNAARGQEVEVSDKEEAARLIAAGVAVEVKESAQASDLKAIRKQLEDLTLEVAELREAINHATEADGEDGGDDKSAKKTGKKN